MPVYSPEPPAFKIGIIKVKYPECEEVLKKLRYFVFEDPSGYKWHCRTLPYIQEIRGDPAKIEEMNIKKNVVFDFKHAFNDDDMDKLIEYCTRNFGNVICAKMSHTPMVEERIDEKHSKTVDIRMLDKPFQSTGRAFVFFETEEAAEKARMNTEYIAEAFKPRKIQQIFNNIYLKNFPLDTTVDELREHFGKYGEIISCVIMKKKGLDGNEKPFAFVCYDVEENKILGAKMAQRAVEETHGKPFKDMILYAQPALPKVQREQILQQNMQRFKNSKKRCNLFVKGFPLEVTKEDLQKIFGNFGTVESIKII